MFSKGDTALSKSIQRDPGVALPGSLDKANNFCGAAGP